MLSNFRNLDWNRRYNLVMVVIIVILLIADQVSGHVVAVHEFLQTGITVAGVGLGLGVLWKFYRERMQKEK
jgi:hypothetical protein